MEEHTVRQVIIVDWDSRQYATIDAWADVEDLDREIYAEREKGRHISCFSHDVADMSGRARWAEQHGLTLTDVACLMRTT